MGLEKRKIIKIKFADKKVTLKRVEENEVKKKGLEELGKSLGLNVGFCAWMGSRYCRDFENRVRYFQIIQEVRKSGKDDLDGGVMVKFYADGKQDKILPQLQSLIIVEELMTKEMYLFKNKEDSTNFCIKRDIEKIPLNFIGKEYMFFDKKTKEFTKKTMICEDIISANADICELIEKTRKKDLLFVFDKNRLVGVIHFCDLISSTAYVYFYAMINLLETMLRKKLILVGKRDEDFFKYLEDKKKNLEEIAKFKEKLEEINLPDFQRLEFTELLKFSLNVKIINFGKISNKKTKRMIGNLIGFRNNIMHNKDIASRQNSEDIPSDMLYERKDYDNFLEAYDLINKLILNLKKELYEN